MNKQIVALIENNPKLARKFIKQRQKLFQESFPIESKWQRYRKDILGLILMFILLLAVVVIF